MKLTGRMLGQVVLVVVTVLVPGSAGSAQEKQQEPKLVKTSSGLMYQDLQEGSGASAKAGDVVEVHYTGWLRSGKKFDSSLDRQTPFSFPLGAGKVIKGWDEGVVGMKEGGKRRLFIPPELGYGKKGAGADIPPDAELIFDVELLKVKKK